MIVQAEYCKKITLFDRCHQIKGYSSITANTVVSKYKVPFWVKSILTSCLITGLYFADIYQKDYFRKVSKIDASIFVPSILEWESAPNYQVTR